MTISYPCPKCARPVYASAGHVCLLPPCEPNRGDPWFPKGMLLAGLLLLFAQAVVVAAAYVLREYGDQIATTIRSVL